MVDHTPTDGTVLRQPARILADDDMTLGPQGIAEMLSGIPAAVDGQPAAPISPQEIAGMRPQPWEVAHGSLVTVRAPRLAAALDAIEALTAENATNAEKATYWRGQHSDVAEELRQAIVDRVAQRVAFQAEVERLKAIIGPKAHCKSCGSVVDMEGEHAMLCDCTENCMPERQRLGPFDPEAYDAFAKLRAEFTELRAQYLADFGQQHQPETYAAAKDGE